MHTAQTRLWVWGAAWQGFLERPILGWGPENFTVVFDLHFNKNFFVPGQNGETWFDRAHSVFFDYLSETGIVGLLSYLGIFVVLLWEFFKTHRRKGASVILGGIILAIPFAYLGQGIAIFDVFPMYLCLFVFLAFSPFYFDGANALMPKRRSASPRIIYDQNNQKGCCHHHFRSLSLPSPCTVHISQCGRRRCSSRRSKVCSRRRSVP